LSLSQAIFLIKRGLFRYVAQNTLLNLNNHTWNNQLLNDHIRTEEFLEDLQKMYEKENSRQVYKIMRRRARDRKESCFGDVGLP